MVKAPAGRQAARWQPSGLEIAAIGIKKTLCELGVRVAGRERSRRGFAAALLVTSIQLSVFGQILLPTVASAQTHSLTSPDLAVPVPVAPGTGSPGASIVTPPHNAAGASCQPAPIVPAGQVRCPCRSLRPRRAGDQRRPHLAGLRRQAGRHRDFPSRQGGPAARRRPSCCRRATTSCMPAFGLASAAKTDATARARPCAKSSTFRPAASGSKAASAMSASRPGRYRSTSSPAASSTPRERRPIAAERDDRRRRAASGGHLLHRLELRRRQFGGALGRPRPGRQAHRYRRHPSRRGDHAQARQRYAAARRSPIRSGRC